MRAAGGKVMLIFSYHSEFDAATLRAQNAGLGWLRATPEMERLFPILSATTQKEG
jgi:predicted NUDIX family NTP pyrophosphohydrolase